MESQTACRVEDYSSCLTESQSTYFQRREVLTVRRVVTFHGRCQATAPGRSLAGALLAMVTAGAGSFRGVVIVVGQSSMHPAEARVKALIVQP